MPMRTLWRDQPVVPIYVIPTEVRYAKILTDKVSPLPTVNLAEAAALARRRLLLMIAARQMPLRPRPRGLDLPSRCGARLMPARLRNKPVLNAPPRARLELMRGLQRTPRGSCRVPKSKPSGLVVELGGPVIFRHRARFESLAATARKSDTGRRTAPRRTAASPAASPVTSRPIALLANAARMQTHVHGRLQRVHSLRRRARLL